MQNNITLYGFTTVNVFVHLSTKGQTGFGEMAHTLVPTNFFFFNTTLPVSWEGCMQVSNS